MGEWIKLHQASVCERAGKAVRLHLIARFARDDPALAATNGAHEVKFWMPSACVFHRDDGIYAPKKLIMEKESRLARIHGWTLCSITEAGRPDL